MKDFIRLAEKGLIVISLLYFTASLNFLGGLPSNDVDPQAATDAMQSASPILLLLQLGVLALTFLLICTQWQRFIYVASKRKFLWAIIALVIASVLWTTVPDLTSRRSIIFLATTCFGFYLAARYPLKEQMRLLAWALGIAIVLNFIYTLAFPAFAIEGGDHQGSWRGIYPQKNVLGRLMVLSALNFLFLAFDSRSYRYLMWIGFFCSIILLILSNSKTALVIFLLLIILVPLYRALRWNYSFVIPFFTILLLVSGIITILLVGNADTILTALGRDVTLTGRTGIWAVVINKIGKHPWLGYGYLGFWRGLEGDSADIWYETYFLSPNAHNGFLDLALDLGLIGVGLFFLSFFKSCWRSLVWLRLNRGIEGVVPIIYLTYLFLYNITESTLITPPNTIFWPLYTAITTSILIQPIQLVKDQSSVSSLAKNN